MPTNRVMHRTDEGLAFEHDLLPWIADMGPGWALKQLKPDEYITEQQRAWFKGVLLPALSKHSGDSKEWWETYLKIVVMPDDFPRIPVAIGRKIAYVVPSITKLGKTKMGKLIDGSVAHLHEEAIFHGEYLWVTLPDSELRK